MDRKARLGTALEQVVLHDGRTLACDLLLVCAGIQANTALAQEMGVAIKRAIVGRPGAIG